MRIFNKFRVRRDRTSKFHPVDSKWQIATSMSSIAVICYCETSRKKEFFNIALSLLEVEISSFSSLPENLPKYLHDQPLDRLIVHSCSFLKPVKLTWLRKKMLFSITQCIFKELGWSERKLIRTDLSLSSNVFSFEFHVQHSVYAGFMLKMKSYLICRRVPPNESPSPSSLLNSALETTQVTNKLLIIFKCKFIDFYLLHLGYFKFSIHKLFIRVC